MPEAVFNPPFWMPIAGFAIALAIAIYGNNRTKSGIRNAGLGVLAAVAAWCGLAYIVQTPLEKCVTRTNEIIAATETGDWAKLRSLLDDETTVSLPNLPLRGKEEIASRSELSATLYKLQNIRVLTTDAAYTPTGVNVNFNALLEGAGTIPSNWRFEYEIFGKEIELQRIVPINVGPFTGDQLRQRVG